MPPRHVRHVRAGHKAFGRDLRLFLARPAPAPLDTADHLNAAANPKSNLYALSTVLITMLIIVSAHLIPRQLSDWTIIALRARLRNVGRSCRILSTGISWPALNQTVCALRFFYGVTLGCGDVPERIAYAREPRKLPVVLSADEVIRFLEAVPSLKARAALTTAYAAGLRASEATHLKVADVDSERMVMRVEHGKGGKGDCQEFRVWPADLFVHWRIGMIGAFA